jgi:hypothetical protein
MMVHGRMKGAMAVYENPMTNMTSCMPIYTYDEKEDMERIWRGYGEDMERIWRGYGEDMERTWRGLERLWRSYGEYVERLRNGENIERISRGYDEDMMKILRR